MTALSRAVHLKIRWQPYRWVWAIWTLIPVLVAIPFVNVEPGASVFDEGSFIEAIQVGLLLTAVCAAGLMTALVPGPRVCRWRTVALGLLALACAAREPDWHIMLNPENLGALGVRYRGSWWLDGQVSLWIKLMWAGVAVAGAIAGAFLVRGAAGPIDWRRARPRLAALAIAFYIGGFVCDDTLRDAVSKSLRQPLEELFELFAAACLVGAVLAPESVVAAPQAAREGSADSAGSTS